MKLFNGVERINTRKGYMIIDGKVYHEKLGWISLENWDQLCEENKDRHMTEEEVADFLWKQTQMYKNKIK